MTSALTHLSDEAFAAHWEDRIEAAAQRGDEAEVEAEMTAYNLAFVDRFGAGGEVA